MPTKFSVLEAVFSTLRLGDLSSRELAVQLMETHRETLLEPEVEVGELAHGACCIWEWILDRRSEPDHQNPGLAYLFDQHGSCAIRYSLHTIVPELESDWNALGESRFDQIFDWEFVPSWCERNLVRRLKEAL